MTPTGDAARATGAGRSAVMRKRLRSAATERLGYKAAALFFALVLWLVVSTEEPAEQLVPVRLTLELDSTIELRGDRPQVRALMAGRGRALLTLFDSPPIVRRAFGPGTPDSVRIAVQPADIELPPGIEATVRDVQPRTVLLRFRRAAPASPTVAADALPAGDSLSVADPDTVPMDTTAGRGDTGSVAPGAAIAPAAGPTGGARPATP